eukprot:1345328-Rhodomonas_salina.1
MARDGSEAERGEAVVHLGRAIPESLHDYHDWAHIPILPSSHSHSRCTFSDAGMRTDRSLNANERSVAQPAAVCVSSAGSVQTYLLNTNRVSQQQLAH